MTYHAVLKKEADRWIGWIAEMPEVRAEGPDEESLLYALDRGVGDDLRRRRPGDEATRCVLVPLIRNGNEPGPATPSIGTPRFWRGETLEELEARHQGPRLRSIDEIAGTWPGEPDDGFEEMINELRRRDTPKVSAP